jgi:hypothetical protein
MTTASRNRPSRGGKSRRWRETADYRAWRSAVLLRSTKQWDNVCAITGRSDEKLEAHHLNGARNHPNLTYNVNNGILISKTVHEDYHKRYVSTSRISENFFSY